MPFHSAMKHENDVSDTISFLQIVRIYGFMKEMKLYTRALFIIIFVKWENNVITLALNKMYSQTH